MRENIKIYLKNDDDIRHLVTGEWWVQFVLIEKLCVVLELNWVEGQENISYYFLYTLCVCVSIGHQYIWVMNKLNIMPTFLSLLRYKVYKMGNKKCLRLARRRYFHQEEYSSWKKSFHNLKIKNEKKS